jgi:predicted nuclease with TOPRIM domain
MDVKEKHQQLRSKYSDEEYIERLEKENKKLREGLALNQGDVARKKMLLEELGQAVSDEIVDKVNGNYLKLKVVDIPEDFTWYMD